MTDPDCEECGGSGECDYGMGEDVRTYSCEKCNDDGGYDEDAEYERHKDAQLEAEIESRNNRD